MSIKSVHFSLFNIFICTVCVVASGNRISFLFWLGFLAVNSLNSSIILINFLPFVLIVNFHLWNYYVPSYTYAREPHFDHLESTSFESTFPCILAHNLHFSILLVRTTEQG